MKPLVRISFRDGQTDYIPGDFLICEYSVRMRNNETSIEAIETSVIWRTEGKGETDIGVHLFERRQKPSLQSTTLDRTQRLSTVLPASPLTYEGKIVKIVWCLRVRLFMSDGTQVTQDQPFRLGQTLPYHELPKLMDADDAVDTNEESNDSPADA